MAAVRSRPVLSRITRVRRRLGWIPRKETPTDFEFLLAIYERQSADFVGSMEDREAEIAVELDIPAIADDLGVHPHIVAGRLIHHLDPKYAAQGKFLFRGQLGETPMLNVVNWPMLQAILAGLWEQRSRDKLALYTAVLSLGIALAAFIVAALA